MNPSDFIGELIGYSILFIVAVIMGWFQDNLSPGRRFRSFANAVILLVGFTALVGVLLIWNFLTADHQGPSVPPGIIGIACGVVLLAGAYVVRLLFIRK
jgi:biotin transporter BioY